MFSVEILHNKDCHLWKTLFSELKRWLRIWGLARKVKLKVVLVETEKDARERRFFGSPQILVNGKDVDPMAEKVTNYHVDGCRAYVWGDKVFPYPPKKMMEQVILNLNDPWVQAKG